MHLKVNKWTNKSISGLKFLVKLINFLFKFITCDCDSRLKTQNSGVSVPGTGDESFYKQLQEILELSYLNEFSVLLFRCTWFKCDARRKVIENNITSIDISAESYKDHQFIPAS